MTWKICLHVMIERPNSPPTTQANPPKRAPCIKTWKFNSNVEQRKRASFQIELYVVRFDPYIVSRNPKTHYYDLKYFNGFC